VEPGVIKYNGFGAGLMDRGVVVEGKSSKRVMRNALVEKRSSTRGGGLLGRWGGEGRKDCGVGHFNLQDFKEGYPNGTRGSV